MENNESKFYSDFIKAKQQFKKTGLSAYNSHFKSKYAKLADIYQAVEDALHDNNLFITHARMIEDGKTYLKTRIRHVTSYYLEDICLIESEKPGNAGHGSSLTYMKRYSVLNLCGIAGSEDEDDDGQEEQRYIEKKQYNKPQYITNSQVNQIETELDDMTEIGKIIMKGNGISTWSQLTVDKFDSVMNTIKKSKEI